MAKSVTIREVAERAGVSKSTVSGIMNGRKGWASKQTRNRILEVIEETGYRPSTIARSLRNQQTKTIGMLIPPVETGNEVAICWFADIERTAAGYGYNVLVSHCCGDAGLNGKRIDDFLDRQVDGLIIAPEDIQNVEKIEELVAERFPIVTIDSRLNFQTDNVSIDRAYGAQQSIEHLISIGRRHLAVILSGTLSPTIQDRITGYRTACERMRMPFSELKIISREFDAGHNAGELMCMELLESGYPVDAIVASNDRVALGAMRTLLKAGRRVPEDVALVGFDDVEFAQALPISLTTVRQPRKIGRVVCDFLLSRMSNRECEFRSVLLRPELVIRESTVAK